MNWRNELKHTINTMDYLILRSRLMAVATPDTHAGPTGKYKIHSLYFENPENKALREKLYGICNREKFRIRYYNDDFSYIRLEKKMKRNNLGCKLSARITKEECEKIIGGDVAWMKDSKEALILELYLKMKCEGLSPKTVVEYIREPFIYRAGNVRVTLDSDIRTGIQSIDFFEQNLPTIKATGSDAIVMEVKYDRFLPEIIRDLIQIKGRKAAPFSKYAMCRMFG